MPSKPTKSQPATKPSKASKPAKPPDASPGQLFDGLMDAATLRKLEPKRDQSYLKRTFYLTEEDVELLEVERARRRRIHGRSFRIADMSTLVREAIRKAYGSAAAAPAPGKTPRKARD